MKFTCDRAPLNEGLQTIIGVVDPRHIKDVLHSIRFVAAEDEVTLSATDLELGMRYRVPAVEVEEPGDIVLPGVQIAGIARELSDEKLQFATDGANCVIQGATSRYRVRGDQSDEFPDIPTFPDAEAIELEGAVLREMIHKTAFSAAPERMRYALNGVLFVLEEGNEKVEAVATDGRRLAWIRRKANGKSPASCEVIVPTKGALQIERMVGQTETVRICLQERHIFAQTAQAELVAQLVDGHFPDFRSVIPKAGDTYVDISGSELAAAMRRSALLTEGDSRATTVQLAEGRMVLTSSSPDGDDAEVSVDVDYKGPEINVTVNPDFVMDGLKVLADSVVRLDIKDNVTACVVRYGSDYVYLTMPITD